MFSAEHLEEMDAGNLARISLDDKIPYVVRYASRAVLVTKLRDFNGAMWMGAELPDRADVIQALRLDFPKEQYVEALCKQLF